MEKVVAYYRVSTREQGDSHLGIEAQQAAVARHAAAYDCQIVASFTEVESAAKDDLANRPALQRAIAHARRSKAVLVIAKLDRLARSVYVTALLHRSHVEFVCCDMPTANRMTIQFMAVVAENEAVMISARTRAALEALKARGVLLGSHRPECRDNLSPDAAAKGRRMGAERGREKAIAEYADLAPIVAAWRAEGRSLRAIAAALNDDGHVTRGGAAWTSMQVSRMLNRSPLRSKSAAA